MSNDPAVRALFICLLAMLVVALLFELLHIRRKLRKRSPRERLGDLFPHLTSESHVTLVTPLRTYTIKIEELTEDENGDLIAVLDENGESATVVQTSTSGKPEVVTRIAGFS